MKKNRQTKSFTVSNSRWVAYAAAGAASAFSAAPPAEAEIHYSGIKDLRFRFGRAAPKQVPLEGSAVIDFANGFGGYSYSAVFGIARAAVSNQFRGYSTMFYPNVSRLASGKLVSQGPFIGYGRHPIGILGTAYGLGAWGTGGPGGAREGGFVGFRFDNGNGKQYGWARLKLSQPREGAASGFILVDYAWGDPGDTVITGQTSLSGDMVDAMPDSGSLGGLAAGAAGLLAWRRRRER
jgi:hypothetical protein